MLNKLSELSVHSNLVKYNAKKVKSVKIIEK